MPWFSIGSVDVFERNLEGVQAESGVDPANFLTVSYKEELEG